jgi:predicted PurR-regulated permease PerM
MKPSSLTVGSTDKPSQATPPRSASEEAVSAPEPTPTAPQPAVDAPTAHELEAARLAQLRIATRLLWGLFIFASLVALYHARAFFIPLAAAILLHFLLRPVVRRLADVGVPPPASALLLVASLVIAMLVGGSALGASLTSWVDAAPQSLAQLEEKLRSLRLPLQRLTETTSRIEEMAEPADNSDAAEPVREPVEVRIRESAFPTTAVNLTTTVVAGMVILLVITFFLLASGDLLLRQLVQAIPRLRDKKQAVEAFYDLEDHISSYLLTVTLINAALGGVVWLALWLLGVPHAMWWGITAGAMNFIPYLGPLVTMVLIFAASILEFDTIGQALIPPLVFVAITSTEGYLVTPTILGRRLSLNPLVVFLWLVFWGWLWGIPGALLAVPMLVCFKIICDHVERLQTLSNVLSGYVRPVGESPP